MIKDKTGKWIGSADGELFDGPLADSAREAFEAWDNDEAPCVAVGQLYALCRFTGHARDIIERMEYAAADECHPDLDCDIHGVTKENLAELDDEISGVLDKWCMRHGVGFTFYGVDPIIKCDLSGPKETVK